MRQRALGFLIAATLIGSLPAVCEAAFVKPGVSRFGVEDLAVEATENGYLYVSCQRIDDEAVSLLSVSEKGYIGDTDGEFEGENTHTMPFDYVAKNFSTVAKYRPHADDGSGETPSADSLVSVDNPSLIIHDSAETNVAGALIASPGGLGPGLIGLAGVVANHFRKRRGL